eukprot:TRINITY_DN8446_c0_g1_i6.p1 TRINITY_DN8446_c0_g1~~TRINITY_DN8446_c0_g1_i6.p1  ORF type:complete len:637 (-),score=143.36 TRINITY_DN8446_c0_g1_i6:114-2024(-)
MDDDTIAESVESLALTSNDSNDGIDNHNDDIDDDNDDGDETENDAAAFDHRSEALREAFSAFRSEALREAFSAFRTEVVTAWNEKISQISDVRDIKDDAKWESLFEYYDSVYCKDAPEDRPFEYKYIARSLLESLRDKLETLRDLENEKVLDLHLAVVNHRLGVNYSETEENSNAEKALQVAIKILAEQVTEESGFKFVDELIDTHNQLGIIWANRGEHKKAHTYLSKAQSIYKNHKSIKGPCSQRTESIYTLTLYYLAQVLGNLGHAVLSSKYIHVTLKRQLDSQKIEPLSWCKHCMQLAGYYITTDAFAFAEHCLLAVERNLPRDVDDSHKANLNILWARYFLGLLKLSRHRLVAGESPIHPTSEGSSSTDQLSASDEDICLESLSMMPSLSPPKSVITLASTYEEARLLFLKGSDYCTKAKEHYPLNGFVTDHVSIVQDMSSLYRNLVFFESDMERKIKMHRRRLGLLEPLLEQLNPAYYLDIVNQLNYELAETNQEMADFKAEQHRQALEKGTKGPTAKKINESILQAIKHYDSFINTFKKDGEFPKVQDEHLEAFLTARYSVARLYSRLIPPDLESARQSLIKALAEYKWIQAYHEKHRFDSFQEELKLCKEMIELLPVKISNIGRAEMRS